MPERRRIMGDRSGAQALRRHLLGLEQLLFAGAGAAFALVAVLLTSPDPSPGDYFVSGLAGAVAGTVAHVLVRGLGVPVPGMRRRAWLATENRERAEKSAAAGRRGRETTGF